MKTGTLNWLCIAALIATASCGSRKPDPSGAEDVSGGGGPAPAVGDAGAPEEPAASAQSRIREWLGEEAAAAVTDLAQKLGAEIGTKLAKDPAVMAAAKKLVGSIFADKQIKKEVDAIADKATEGFANKLTLVGKVLSAGGIEAYKKKVTANALGIATEVIVAHLKNEVFKDPRTAEALEKLVPALKLQAVVAAASVEENLSPRVSKKILGIALRMAAAGGSAETAAKVEAWIEGCEGHVEGEMEKLLVGVAGLGSTDRAVQGLVVEVLGHPTTQREISRMVREVMDDRSARQIMIDVYAAAALEKGDDKVRDGLRRLLANPAVDKGIYAAMDRLAAAEGAGALLDEHLGEVGADEELAGLVDDSIVSLLETCGDPTR